MCGRGKPIRYSRSDLTWDKWSQFVGYRNAYEIAKPQNEHWYTEACWRFVWLDRNPCFSLVEV